MVSVSGARGASSVALLARGCGRRCGLNRFGHVRRADRGGTFEVGDGARDAQHLAVGARGEAQPLDRADDECACRRRRGGPRARRLARRARRSCVRELRPARSRSRLDLRARATRSRTLGRALAQRRATTAKRRRPAAGTRADRCGRAADRTGARGRRDALVVAAAAARRIARVAAGARVGRGDDERARGKRGARRARGRW